MAFPNYGKFSGFLSQDWLNDQHLTIPHDGKLLNSTLKPLGRVFPADLIIPDGVFVRCEPSAILGGGYTIKPTFHGWDNYKLPRDTDETDFTMMRIAQQIYTEDCRYGHVFLDSTCNNPVPVDFDVYMMQGIVNTGNEPLQAGDCFVVEPPTEDDTARQLQAFKTSSVAQGIYKTSTLVGGFPATHKQSSCVGDRFNHLAKREVALCTSYAKQVTASGTFGNLLANPVSTNVTDVPVYATTLQMLESMYGLVKLIRTLDNLLSENDIRAIVSDYIINRETQLTGSSLVNKMPDYKTLITTMWTNPLTAELFLNGIDNGLANVQKYLGATVGTVIRYSQNDPNPRNGEIVLNAYAGQYPPGSRFLGVVHKTNGFQV